MVFRLMETWLNNSISNSLINIKDFNIARLDRKINKKGGGVLLHIRDDLEWDNIDSIYNVSNKNIELLTVLIQRKYTKPIYISAVYIPPTGNINECITQLDQIADYISSKNADWLLGGDFNVDLNAKKKKTTGVRMLENYCNRNSLSQLINSNKRSTKNTTTLIDHIYANNIGDIGSSGVIICIE